MDLSAIGQTQQTHRDLVAWFSSPRVAVRTAYRLAETVPSIRIAVRPTDDHGAEGQLVALVAEIPWLWSTLVTRQLTGPGVALVWDPGEGECYSGWRSAA